MRLKLPVLLLLIILPSISNSQVGIGTTAPSASSMLDINASDKGILIPRVDLENLNSASPVDNPEKSLLLWNTDAANGGSRQGFYFWTGSNWSMIGRDSKPAIFADKYNTNDLLINANRPISFDTQTANEGIISSNNTYFVIPQDGYYRVSFNLSIQKNGNGNSSNGVYMFYLSKFSNPSGKINGTTVRTEIANQFNISNVYASKILYLEEDDKLYLMTQRKVDVLSESSFNIEYVNN